MRNVLLSICISSYKKGNRCTQLVRNLLTVMDDRFNIFICDDCSDSDTVRNLRELQSSKVALVRNENNLGPCKNWYRTIDCGNGEYILQVLDRDDIDVGVIRDVLNILEKHPVGAGYIGKSAINSVRRQRGEKFTVCRKGEEAFLAMAGVPIHPTGFLVNRTVWERGNFKKFFEESEKYGIYPHSYVMGIIAAKQNMLYMPASFCTYEYKGENKRSGFYQNFDKKNYWWLPDNIIKTANQLILYLYHAPDEDYRDEFVIRRTREGLVRATRGYRAAITDVNEMKHYGVETHNVSKWELLIISVKYYFIFKHVLKKLDLQSGDIKKRVNRIWAENIKSMMDSI